MKYWKFYIGKMDRSMTYIQQLIWVGPLNLSHTILGRQITLFGYGFSFGDLGIYILAKGNIYHIYKTKLSKKYDKEYEAWKASQLPKEGIVVHE